MECRTALESVTPMAETLFPGVFVEELPTHVRPIEGVSTSTAALLGIGRSDLDPVLVTSFRDFEEAAGSNAAGFLPLAVRAFFENGGQRCYVTPQFRVRSDRCRPRGACATKVFNSLLPRRASILRCGGAAVGLYRAAQGSHLHTAISTTADS
jgi:hypothetical protein